MFAISIANYVHEPALAREQRSDCPVLDTFDMLSPQYDQPQTQHEIEQALSDCGGILNFKRLDIGGLTIIGEKSATGST